MPPRSPPRRTRPRATKTAKATRAAKMTMPRAARRRPEAEVTRGGREKTRDEPERRCIVTRATGPKAGLIRFVVGPDDGIVPDLAERLPGRGLWVAADRKTLDVAAAKGHFARAAKTKVRVAPGLADLVEG